MRRVYHLVPRAVWERSPTQPYRAASLESEGFIHCSHAAQVARSANRFFADEKELLVLALDAERLGGLLRDEPAGDGELYPHLYGPLDRALVVAAEPLRRGPDGRWLFPS
jgi:uncharacterized protein (DUF952 family)